MSRSGFISVEKIISRILRNLKDSRRLREELILFVWEEVVGKGVSRNTSPQRVFSGIMTVNTNGSAWAQELSLQKEEIRKRLNERIGFDLITDIRFRAGDVYKHSEGPSPKRLGPDKEDSRTAREISAVIKDSLVAESFGRFLEHELCRQRIRREHGWVKCICCGALHAGEKEMCMICRKASPSSRNIESI